MNKVESNMEHIRSQYARFFTPDAHIKVPDGWFWLVSGMCQSLESYGNDDGTDLTIHAMDQRLGTLCVRYSGGNATTDKIIIAVQMISNAVCEVCAGTRNVGSSFGTCVATVCEGCLDSDDHFFASTIIPNQFSEAALAKIEAGLLVMPETWFKRHLQSLV